MKLIFAMLAIFSLACSTSSKNANPPASSQTAATSAAGSGTQTASANKDDENEKHHRHHHHHKKTEENESQSHSAGQGVTCKNGDDERTIAVQKTDEGCTVNYTKSGKTDAIATGSSNMSHCNEVSAKIQKNLEGSGFTCK